MVKRRTKQHVVGEGEVDHEVGHTVDLGEGDENNTCCEETDVREGPKTHKPLGRHLVLSCLRRRFLGREESDGLDWSAAKENSGTHQNDKCYG